jgi:hypothetical protein
MKKLLIVTAALCAIPATAFADETLKFRTTVHALSVQSQDVGDTDGHTMFLSRFSGLASFPDGAVGKVYLTSAADFTKGAGPFSVYHNLTLSDGSVLWFKVNAMAKPNGPDTDFTGTLTVLGGKGRFEGAKGDGYFTGARLI